MPSVLKFSTRVQPYYDQDGITIYHGDCNEVLPSLQADVLLTDPPWLTSHHRSEWRGKGVAKSLRPTYSLKYGTIGFFDSARLQLAASRVTGDCLVIVGYKELATVASMFEPVRGIFVWHKPNAVGLRHAYPAKLDTSFIVWGGRKSSLYGRQVWPSTVFSIALPTAGCVTTGERFTDGWHGAAVHPAQGPLSLYERLLLPLDGKVILDPYMGTGTTLRAAKNLGMRAIGIEIEERYCELAARRLAQLPLPFAA